MPGGRKGFGEELRIKERFTSLSEPYFQVLKEFLEGEDKIDKKFAVSELTKAFTKMIPQQLTGDSESPITISILGNAIRKDDSNSKDTQPEQED